MKRIVVLFVLSGIVFTILFSLFVRNNSSSVSSFTKYIPKEKVESSSLERNNTIDLSRVIASREKDTNIEHQPRRFKTISERNIASIKKISHGSEDTKFLEGESFRRIEDLYVIEKNDFTEGLYEVVERRNRYVIVRSESPVGTSTMAVVRVKGSKHLGIVTGVLKVQLENFSDRDILLDGHNYEISSEYQHLNRVFYQFESLEEAKAAYEDIKDRVAHVEIEILQFERSER